MNTPDPTLTADTLDATTTTFSLSVLTATRGNASKKLIEDAHGQPARDPTHSLAIAAGRLEHVELPGLEGLAALLGRVTLKQALVHGVPIGTRAGTHAALVTAERLEAERAKHPEELIIARSAAGIAYPEGVKLLMLDIDPAPDAQRYEHPADIWQRLTDIWPAFADVGYLATASTSSAIRRKDAQDPEDWVRPPDGWHLYFLCTGDVVRWRELAKIGLWNADTGWCKLACQNAQTGVSAVLERCLVDLTVWSPERLDYVAGALLDKTSPFVQRRIGPTLHPGGVLDLDALPDPTAAERERYHALVHGERERVQPERLTRIRAHIRTTDPNIAEDALEQEVTARVQRAQDGVLASDHRLSFANGTTWTAGAVSAKLDNLRLADPCEPGYGNSHAVFHWNAGRWLINSFAHGMLKTYRLVHERPEAPEPDPDEPWPEPGDQTGDQTAPPDDAPPEPIRAQTYDYIAYTTWLGLVGKKDKKTGKRPVYRLTNFGCEVVAETTRDDGSGALRKVFEMRAHVAGHTLSCEVPAEEFTPMHWVPTHLGAQAVVMAGQGRRDHARAAIQLLSRHLVHRYIYEHTGWTTLADGGLVYLHAGGAQSASGLREEITVDLPGVLSRYSLPPPPTSATRTDAIRQSLALRHVLEDGAMVPLLGGTYLAPLRQFLLPHDPPDFVLWLYGPTGSFKSETAALCLNHYGPEFSGKTLPGSFVATANALERMAFATKDALLVVDDFHPATTRKESESMAATVSRLLRGVGNGTGRARMNSDTTARPDLPPRGVVLATGERLPDGQSTNARMFLVSLAPAQDGTAMAARLTEAQRHREAYALAMSGYLAWLAGQDATFAPALTQRFYTLRETAQTAGAHTRQPGAVAHLMLAWEYWTRYALESGALTADEREALLAQVGTLLTAVAAAQADSLQTLRPDQMALDLLRDGIAGKRAYLETLEGKAPKDGADWGWVREVERDGSGGVRDVLRRPPGGVLLGYVTDDWLYLLPEAHHQFLCKAARDAGQVFPVGKDTLHKHMDTAGLIQSHVEQGRRRLTVQQRPCPGRVLKFKRLLYPLYPPGGRQKMMWVQHNLLIMQAVLPLYPLYPPKWGLRGIL